MNTLARDFAYALRMLAKSPGFTLAAILSLAIGIGANTSIFSIVNALLLRPLPYRDADRLVILWNRSPGLNITEDWFSTAQYFDIKNGHPGFEQVAIVIGGNYKLSGDCLFPMRTCQTEPLPPCLVTEHGRGALVPIPAFWVRRSS